MNDKTKIYLAGMGMITPLGANADMTATMARTGINRYQISEYKNRVCKPITMASVPEAALPEICDELGTHEDLSEQMTQMLLMASIALDEVMTFYPGEKPLPLILCGPEADLDLEVPFSYSFFDLLATQTSIKFDRTNSRLIGMGRAGVIEGIDMAMKYLSQGHDYILVGGVDSFRDYDLLLKLSEQERVKAEDIKDGFAPGEAAGFLLLTGKRALAEKFGEYRIGISEPGLAQEAGHLYSEATYTGDGLTNAVRKALANHTGSRVNRVYSSMNGENFWAKEYGVAMMRNKAALEEPFKIEHPADCFGDLGAATGVVLIGMAGSTLIKEAKAQSSLVYCSSDRAPRGAVCLGLV